MVLSPRPRAAAACIVASLAVAAAEEEATSADVAGGVMLIASVTAVMFTFIMVSVKDDFVRIQTWKVISFTISIFAAVMAFQAFNGMFQEYIWKQFESAYWRLPVVFLWMLLWFAILQVFLAVATGATHHSKKLSSNRETNKTFVECWSMIFGHVTGFAAIAAFGYVQELLKHVYGGAFIAVAFCVATLTGLLTLTYRFRKHVAAQDGIDKWERRWDAKTQEVENDAFALTVSFLMTNALRQQITGVLPNAEGVEEHYMRTLHPVLGTTHVFELLACGAAMACLAVMWEFKKESVAKCLKSLCACAGVADVQHENFRRIERLKDIFASYGAMSVSWCWFFSAQWFFENLFGPWVRHTTGTISLALFCTLGAYAVIVIGGALQHLIATTGDKVKWHRLIIIVLVKAMGMCIGFAWEKGFDSSIDAIGESLVSESKAPLVKFVLSIFICLIVIPGWRFFMLPKVLKMEEDEGGDDALIEALLNDEETQEFEEAEKVQKEMGDAIRNMKKAFQKRLKELEEEKEQARIAPGNEKEYAEKVKEFANKVIQASQEKIPVTFTLFDESHGLTASFTMD